MKNFKTYAPIGTGFLSALLLGFGLWSVAPVEGNHEDIASFGIDQTTVAAIPASTAPDTTARDSVALVATAPKAPFDDPLMNEAVRISHLHLDKFDAKFNQWPEATFWVEAVLSDGNRKELLWLKVSERVIDGYIATVDEAFGMSNIVPKGDPIHLSQAEVVDWRIDNAGALYGAYTTRVRLSQVASPAALKVLSQFKDL
ncbi:MAG: DUF2314 domain-containing protein [Hyphomicrobiales bacterium]